MFTITEKSNNLPFILHIEMGFFTNLKSLRFCLVEFDQNTYKDEWFSHYQLLFPVGIRSAVVKRKAEYLAGRYAVQCLLKESGCYKNVLTGKDQSPQWPEGWSGSISHTNRWAITVVAPASARLIPGIDIECLSPEILRETASLFTTSTELRLLKECDLDTETALLITFSAKECLYKSLYPSVQQFFGFEVATICKLDPINQTFSLKLTTSLMPKYPKGIFFHGYYHIKNNTVITLIF